MPEADETWFLEQCFPRAPLIKYSHYLFLLKKKATRFIFLFTNFLGARIIWQKILFNELKTTLEQRFNKPLDEH